MAKIKGKSWKEVLKNTTYYNKQNRENLAPAISKLAAVANKRLKRLEAAGKEYGYYEGDDAIAGVKKFGAKGKTVGELRSEYKRLRGFLESETSTLTGRKERYYQAVWREWQHSHKLSEPQPKRSEVYKEYLQGANKVDLFDALSKIFEKARNEGWLGRSIKLQKIQDSDNMRKYYEERVINAGNAGKTTIEDIIEDIKKDLGVDSIFEDSTESDGDVSTSSFFK